MNSSGDVTAVNTVGKLGLVSRHCGSTSTFYAFDPQGSTAETLNSTGSVTNSFETDAFGKTQSSLTTTDPFSGFGAEWGYYTDSETGLELLGQRYYDPSSGRFLNRDPVDYEGGINLYGYVGNQPLDHFDAGGLAESGVPGRFPNKPIPPPVFCPGKHTPPDCYAAYHTCTSEAGSEYVANTDIIGNNYKGVLLACSILTLPAWKATCVASATAAYNLACWWNFSSYQDQLYQCFLALRNCLQTVSK